MCAQPFLAPDLQEAETEGLLQTSFMLRGSTIHSASSWIDSVRWNRVLLVCAASASIALYVFRSSSRRLQVSPHFLLEMNYREPDEDLTKAGYNWIGPGICRTDSCGCWPPWRWASTPTLRSAVLSCSGDPRCTAFAFDSGIAHFYFMEPFDDVIPGTCGATEVNQALPSCLPAFKCWRKDLLWHFLHSAQSSEDRVPTSQSGEIPQELQDLQKLFQDMDADGNERVSFHEFQEACQLGTWIWADEHPDVEQTYRAINWDGGTGFGMAELSHWALQEHPEWCQALPSSAAFLVEQAVAPTPLQELQVIFSKMDLNGDGNVSSTEFRKVFKADHSAKEVLKSEATFAMITRDVPDSFTYSDFADWAVVERLDLHKAYVKS